MRSNEPVLSFNCFVLTRSSQGQALDHREALLVASFRQQQRGDRLVRTIHYLVVTGAK
jgi:hypothetical protein